MSLAQLVYTLGDVLTENISLLHSRADGVYERRRRTVDESAQVFTLCQQFAAPEAQIGISRDARQRLRQSRPDQHLSELLDGQITINDFSAAKSIRVKDWSPLSSYTFFSCPLALGTATAAAA